MEPGGALEQELHIAFGGIAQVTPQHQPFEQLADGKKGPKLLQRLSLVLVGGEELAARGVALPAEVPTPDQEPPLGRVGEHY